MRLGGKRVWVQLWLQVLKGNLGEEAKLAPLLFFSFHFLSSPSLSYNEGLESDAFGPCGFITKEKKEVFIDILLGFPGPSDGLRLHSIVFFSSGSGLTADSSVLTLTLSFLDFGLDFAQSFPFHAQYYINPKAIYENGIINHKTIRTGKGNRQVFRIYGVVIITLISLDGGKIRLALELLDELPVVEVNDVFTGVLIGKRIDLGEGKSTRNGLDLCKDSTRSDSASKDSMPGGPLGLAKLQCLLVERLMIDVKIAGQDFAVLTDYANLAGNEIMAVIQALDRLE
ncbi:hypothetical protein Tco_1192900 [Tanacetum coccineum]